MRIICANKNTNVQQWSKYYCFAGLKDGLLLVRPKQLKLASRKVFGNMKNSRTISI